MKPVYLTTIVFAAVLFFACGKTPRPCTMEYRTYVVKVKDTSGRPVKLSKHYVIRLKNGDTLYYGTYSPWNIQDSLGEYTIMGDRSDFSDNEPVDFYGYVQDSLRIKERYSFTFNECNHLSGMQGKSEIILK